MSPAGSVFDPLADAYDAARPSYPDDLYDAIERLAVPLHDACVVEVGAGTGIATTGLRDRGARVLAVDIGPGMLRRLRQRLPEQPAVLARAEQLPVRGGAVDLVCAAQAWHWVHPERGPLEVKRVLRRGGALAVWWNNVRADGERWYEDQQNRLEAMSPGYTRDYREPPMQDPFTPYFEHVEVFTTHWSRTIRIDAFITWQTSKSYVAAIGERLREYLEAERASILDAFPDGVITEPFEVRLVVARDRA
ncbi:MAG: class I SAM-dependent methyltransferase [Actinomycetes bacterium]